MKLDLREKGGISILVLGGQLTGGGGHEQFQEAIDTLLAGGRNQILVDFTEITFMDSAGMGELVSGHRTVERFGGIDILVCNAAVNPFFGKLKDIPDSAFDKIMETNIRSNHWLCQMTNPHMAARGGGSIMIISSVGGLRAGGVLGAYGISKAADLQIARALAVEFGGDNIRVNAIAPGLIRTDFARALWEDKERVAKREAVTPLSRLGEADEIVGVAVMLASAAGGYVSGETIVVDGGAIIAS